MKMFKNGIKGALVLVLSVGLFACGSSSSSSTPLTPSTTLKGTAAAGAAVIGTVTVKGALGNTKSAVIEASGNYSVDVSSLTAPYRLRATGTVGGRTINLHSYAEAADLGGNVNITPFTDLIVANAAQQIASAFFDSTTTTSIDAAELVAQEKALQDKLQDVFTALGVDSAINLLNTTFSADHSGLDAALDIIRIEVDTATNVATIKNTIDNTTMLDSITDTNDNTVVLAVTDATGLANGATEIQAIAAVFGKVQAAFATGLPTPAAIRDLLSVDFSDEDENREVFLTDITTDPTIVGLMFNGLSVSNLDTAAGTAMVTFTFGVNGITDFESETWFVKKDATLGWQTRGDQRIVEAWSGFHCNDSDGDGPGNGTCGINVDISDNDFTNNGTSNAPIVSATAEVVDGTSGNVKATVFLGTSTGSAPGFLQVFKEGSGFQGDFKSFGTGVGQIDPTKFAAGDTLRYKVYTEALDVSNSAAPQIAVGATPVATYTETVLFAPSTTPNIPSVTAETKTAIANFTLGSNLTIAWTLPTGTRNSEVLVVLSDGMGNFIDVSVDTFFTSATTTTFASTQLDAAATSAAGFDPNATSYSLLVRVFVGDAITGQEHSRDYTATIPGPAAP